jgi:hypothetical protein
MTVTADAVSGLEQFFEDYVTRTPIELKFTAAECATYLGEDTWTVSQWLQRYRDVQGNLTLFDSEYIVASFNRGPRSMWFILGWPNMTSTQRTLAGELLVEHEIMSLIKEEITPMLRNIDCQFGPAVVKNRSVNITMRPVLLTKLDGYRGMLLSFQRDVTHIRPMTLRRHAIALSAALTSAVNEVDLRRNYLTTAV